jgi:lipopolysaccharide/colanic/teichoic acid biosynthesis glycosyltransferase
LEQRRTERSKTPFVLLLLEFPAPLNGDAGEALDRLMRNLADSIRATDTMGWYEEESTAGIIYTEIDAKSPRAVGSALATKIRGMVSSNVPASLAGDVRVSFCVFPEDWDQSGRGNAAPPVLHRSEPGDTQTTPQIVKRGMDIAGSLFALIVASPLFLVIAAAVKFTSKGPVLFRQERLGQFGRRFTFLKFRSMYTGNDPAIHRDYVKDLITGSVPAGNGTNGRSLYKLTADPRITPIGRFLRKTSLDELPQFLNVLRGEMSLVGPRPPITYEVESYDLWHRRRLMVAKPGITGLWQVRGRSKTTFDEMVRLDLRYACSWSLWLDLKILLETPRAVLSGDGAY